MPPGFRAFAGGDAPFGRACAAARGDEGREESPGAVFWGEHEGVCALGVVLAPEADVSGEALETLGLVALYDALAVLAPPQVPITRDGAGLRVDGGRAARVAVERGADWAVLGMWVAMSAGVDGQGADGQRADGPGADDPGARPDETSLGEEGFEGVDGAAVVMAVCRHLLAAIDAFGDEGAAWLERALAERALGERLLGERSAGEQSAGEQLGRGLVGA